MRIRPGITLAAAAAVAAGIFAAWPLQPRSFPAPPTEILGREPASKNIATLDLAAFRTPIWIAEPPPPRPPAAVPAPPPPPPLKIQLLAIIREGDTYRAAIYDPDTDRVLVIAAGEKLGLRTVERVDQSSLTLRDDTGSRTLALNEGGAQ